MHQHIGGVQQRPNIRHFAHEPCGPQFAVSPLSVQSGSNAVPGNEECPRFSRTLPLNAPPRVYQEIDAFVLRQTASENGDSCAYWNAKLGPGLEATL